jgi:hypothetical protein
MRNAETARRSLTSRLCLAVLAVVLTSQRGSALGPNLMANNGFEGGAYGYSKADVAPFSVVEDPANARTGVRALRVVGQPSGSCSIHDPLFLWPKTSYTTSAWCRGDGAVRLQIMKGDYSAEIAHVDLAATKSWRKTTLTFDTGPDYYVGMRISQVGGPGTTVYLDDLYTGLTGAHTIAFDPRHPAGHGFKLLFRDEFNDSRTIDVNNTQTSGFHWYLHQWYWLPETAPSMFSVHDGVLTITDCPVPFSDTLHTAAPANNRDGFVGTVFCDTAPLYFESRFRVRDFDRTGTSKGDPGFWSQDLSMGTGINKDMPGHPGHAEMIENDFIEMNHQWGGTAGEHISGFGDWCDPGSIGDANVQFPRVGTDYGQFHVYGCLLVPATAANGWNGYRTIYFDGVPMISTCWVGNQQYEGPFPETRESMGSYRFSRLDSAWEVMILGDGQGGVSPMDIDYVRVYGVSHTSLKVGKGAAPATPGWQWAVAGDRQVTFGWAGTGGRYDVYRGTTPGAEGAKPIATVASVSSYTDTGLTNGTTYHYKVVAANGVGRSGMSGEASATPAPDGPNLVSDPGFEGDAKSWTIKAPFALVHDPAKVRAGSGALELTMADKQSWVNAYQRVDLAKNTNYAAGLWARGSGRCEVAILDHTWTEGHPLATIDVAATASWRKVMLPTFNSGDNDFVFLLIRDRIPGGGTLSLDDCFLHSLGVGK